MALFKNILVSYGDEIGGDDALGQAVKLARESGARLTVAALPRRNAQTRSIIAETEKRLQRLATGIRDLGVPHVATKILMGSATTEIVGQAARHNHDLLISSSETAKSFLDVIQGGATGQLIRNCPCPVWIIKPGDNTRNAQILAAVEAAEGAPRQALDRKILEMATSLALQDGACLHIVSAWKVASGENDTIRSGIAPQHRQEILERHRCAHETELYKLLALVPRPGLNFRVYLTEKPPNIAITEIARRESIDLVVMGAISKRSLSGFWSQPMAGTVLDTLGSGLVAVKPGGLTGAGLKLTQPVNGEVPDNRAMPEPASRVA